MIFLVPRARDFTPEIDRAWAIEEKRRLGLPSDWQLTVEIAPMPAENLVFQNEAGEPLMSAADAIKMMFPAHPEKLEERLASFDFPESAYLETGDDRFPRVRIKSVSAKISRSRIEEQMITDFGSIPVLIVRDVTEGSIKHWLDKDFRILGV